MRPYGRCAHAAVPSAPEVYLGGTGATSLRSAGDQKAIRTYNAALPYAPTEKGPSLHGMFMDYSALSPEASMALQDDVQQVMSLFSDGADGANGSS